MDDLIQYNKERWEALAQANVAYAQPFLDLTPASARAWLEAKIGYIPGLLADLPAKNILCLASGGGQQTAVFGLLGANVTVFDLSETQLQRDRQAAAHYGFNLCVEQGDMRDLAVFADDSFDLIWQPYSINFVPDTAPVFDEVCRILRPGGLYRLQFNNPFRAGVTDEDWNGDGYVFNRPYVEGLSMWPDDDTWEIGDEDGRSQRTIGPKEFNHTLGGVVNGLIKRGFALHGLWEDTGHTTPDSQAKPGSWAHFIAVAPLYLVLWAQLVTKRDPGWRI